MIDVSIIVSVYNKVNYLERCIRSVLNSDFDNYEIICVEDGSEDGSRQLLREIAIEDARIVVIENLNNFGVAYSRNKGIEQAKGKYIMFLDADDYLSKNALKKYYSLMEKQSAEICFIKIEIENETAESNIKCSYPGVYLGLEILGEFVKNDEFFLYACGVLYKREFLIEKELRFKNLKTGEGGLLILEAILFAKKVVVCDEVGYFYNINETSVNQSENAMKYAIIGQIKQILFMIDQLKKLQQTDEIKLFLDWYLKKNIGGIINLNENEQKEVEEYFVSEYERFIFSLIRGEYLNNKIIINEDQRKVICKKKKVYLYGAGYETLGAIKFCHSYDIEIVKIFVTKKENNPNTMYGYPITKFDETLIEDFSIPVIITAHRKHQESISKKLISCGVMNVIGIL